MNEETNGELVRRGSPAAMQAAVCMLLAAGLLVLNIFRPATALGLFTVLRDRSGDSRAVVENPIVLVEELLR